MNRHGSSSCRQALSRPTASAALLGHTTLIPGTCIAQASSACECWGPLAIPTAVRMTIGAHCRGPDRQGAGSVALLASEHVDVELVGAGEPAGDAGLESTVDLVLRHPLDLGQLLVGRDGAVEQALAVRRHRMGVARRRQVVG